MSKIHFVQNLGQINIYFCYIYDHIKHIFYFSISALIFIKQIIYNEVQDVSKNNI